jgi:hypothetical protein
LSLEGHAIPNTLGKEERLTNPIRGCLVMGFGLRTIVDVKKSKNVWYRKMKKWYEKVKKFCFVVIFLFE